MLIPAPLGGPIIPAKEQAWGQICANGAGAGSCPPNYQPPQTYKAGAFWDAADVQEVYFGGVNATGVVKQQTWAYQNGSWNQTFQGDFGSPPPARANMSMAWESNGGYGILFGGWAPGRCFGDTWEFEPFNRGGNSNGSWVNITATAGTPPAARCGALMTDVPSHGGHGGYLLLFGGKNVAGQWYNDTWTFGKGGPMKWVNQTSTVGNPAPSPRVGSGITYDNGTHIVILWGGLTQSGLTNDTWEFLPATLKWSLLHAANTGGPKSRMDVEMAFSTNASTEMLTGGATGSLASLSSEVAITFQDTWYLSVSGNWVNDTNTVKTRTNAVLGTFPTPVFGATFTDEPALSAVLMQGGRSATPTVVNATAELGILLFVTLQVTSTEFPLGTAFTAWANVTGLKNGTLTFSWTNSIGCSPPGNVSTFTCTPTIAATTKLTVNVTDQGGATVGASVVITVDIAANLNAVLTISPTVVVPPKTFWGVTSQCYPENTPGCVAWLQQANIHYVRIDGKLEAYNSLTGQSFNRQGGFFSPNWNLTDTKLMCAAIAPCYLEIPVPTQNNYSALTTSNVNFVQVNHTLPVAYWELGNEPSTWVLNGSLSAPNFLPANYPFSPTPYPTPYNHLPSTYGYELGIVAQKLTPVVEASSPTSSVIVVQSATCGNNSFSIQSALYTHNIANTIVGCHSYPGGTQLGTASSFLSYTNLSRTAALVQQERAGLLAACGVPCQQLPIFINELNGAQGGSLIESWPGVAWWGAVVSQLAVINVSQIAPFALQCGTSIGLALLDNSCNPKPVAQEYINIFKNLYFGSVQNVTFSGGPGKAYGIVTKNASGTSLMVTNANSSIAVTFTAPIAMGSQTTVRTGDPNGLWTSTTYIGVGSAPTTFKVPAEGILLVNTNAGGGGSTGVPGVSTMMLSASSLGGGEIQLTWPSNPYGTTANFVYGSSDCQSFKLIWSGTATNQVLVNGLPFFGTYCVYVTATGPGGTLGLSRTIQVQLGPIPVPLLPSSAWLTRATPLAIALAVAGISGVLAVVFLLRRRPGIAITLATVSFGVIFIAQVVFPVH